MVNQGWTKRENTTYLLNILRKKEYIINALCLTNDGLRTFAFSRTYDLEPVHARDRPGDYLTRQYINRRRRNDSIIYERYAIVTRCLLSLLPLNIVLEFFLPVAS